MYHVLIHPLFYFAARNQLIILKFEIMVCILFIMALVVALNELASDYKKA